MAALHWIRAGSRPFFCDGLTGSLRHFGRRVWKQGGQRAAWIPPPDGTKDAASETFSTGRWVRNSFVEKMMSGTRIFFYRAYLSALHTARPWISSRDARRILRLLPTCRWVSGFLLSQLALFEDPVPSGRMARGVALHDSSWIDYSAESGGREALL